MKRKPIKIFLDHIRNNGFIVVQISQSIKKQRVLLI